MAIAAPLVFASAPAAASTPQAGPLTEVDGLAAATQVSAVAWKQDKPEVYNLRLSDVAVLPGGTVSGTVDLDRPSPTGGTTVALRSTPAWPNNIVIPRDVTVSKGRTTAKFTIHAGIDNYSAVAVRITADLGTSSWSRPLALVSNDFQVSGGDVVPGKEVTGAVGIGMASNPRGTTVALQSDSPNLWVPTTTIIPAGSPGVFFPVRAIPGRPPTAFATITATWNGQSVSGRYYFI